MPTPRCVSLFLLMMGLSLMFNFPKPNYKDKKKTKPSFEEWLNRASELLNEYMDESVDDIFKPQGQKSQNKKNIKKENIQTEEGDKDAQMRIEEAIKKREEEKIAEEKKKSKRRLKLKKAMIYSEILAKPLAKRK